MIKSKEEEIKEKKQKKILQSLKNGQSKKSLLKNCFLKKRNCWNN